MKIKTHKNYTLYVCIFLLAFTFISLANPALAQRKQIDSLLSILKTSKEDTLKALQLNNIAEFYRSMHLPDSSLHYSDRALRLSKQLEFKKGIGNHYWNTALICFEKGAYDLTIENLKQAEAIFHEQNIDDKLTYVYVRMGFVYAEQYRWHEAKFYLRKAFTLAKKSNDAEAAATIFNNLSQIYQAQDNYPKALEYLLISLKFKELTGDKKGMASCYNNLGAIFNAQENYSEALKNYAAALNIRKELKEMKGVAICYNNMGLVYDNLKNYNDALNYFNSALEIIGNKAFYHAMLTVELNNNMATVYLELKNNKSALKYVNTALKLSEEIKYSDGIASSLITLGSINKMQNDFKTARLNFENALLYAKANESKNQMQLCYENLSSIDSLEGKWESAYKNHKLFIAYRDSINNETNTKKILELSLKNEFEREKEKTKAENEKQQAIAEERTHRQTVISWSIGGGLFLVIVFAGFVLRSLRITNKQKNIIEAQKDEVTKQKDIAEELRDLAEKQKHIVEEKQKEIVDSITYAKRIQTALLTSDEYIRNNFEAEHFILFKPKDIVSGDFYWALSHPFVPGWDLGITTIKLQSTAAERRKNLFYIATADCTGHGVPGAFMSMLNISFLNENIIERGILQPHEILNAQRKEIIKALNPEGSKSESKDGMDCILCVYDFNKMLMHFAAANNPLWLVRNNELIEFKADKMPVGKYNEHNEPFTLQTIELQKGDIIYTSTDGYADQFGDNGKKLMKKQFKEELLNIHQLPMQKQKEHLNDFFEKWKGSQEQVDDVCVIGVRV